MTEKRFYIKHERTIKDRNKYVTESGYVFSYPSDAEEVCNLLNSLAEENEQLKEALREELQDNGNAYYIEIYDKLFNLDYDEWDRNERYRECTDWEKILKEKGDV